MAQAPPLTQNVLREGLALARTPDPNVMVIFGASGDLTKRKLFPALYNLALQHLLPNGFSVVGFSRQDLSDDVFRGRMREGINDFSRNRPVNPAVWDSFEQGVFYHAGNFDDHSKYESLAQRLEEIDRDRGTSGNRLFYLATPPSFFSDIIARLGEAAGRLGLDFLDNLHVARLRGLLQSRCHVDRIARDEGAAFARLADDDLTRVDPDPQGERLAEEFVQTPLHRERPVKRTLGVILER